MTDEDVWAMPVDDPIAEQGGTQLAGRVAVVAGGGLSGPEGGVGFAMAWLFARQGARVAVLDRDPVAAQRTVDGIVEAGGEAAAFEVDLTSDESCARAIGAVMETFGAIDAVADSVAGSGLAGIFEATPEEWEREMLLSTTTAWILLRNAERFMTRGGTIVTISSGAVEGRGPGLPYGVAKAALERLTIGAAGTLAPRGIRANVVRVGMIWSAFAARGISQEQRRVRSQNVALATEGNVWDIAAAALFLSTAQSRWITGQVISVDGGGTPPRNAGQAGRDFAEIEKDPT